MAPDPHHAVRLPDHLTDVFIAGRIGKEVQASIGFIAQLYFLFIVVANALTVGTVAVVTRLHGSESREELSDAVASITLATIIAGVLLGIAVALAGPSLLRVFGMPADIIRYGSPLIVIYATGLPFHYYLINTNGVLRSTGRVRRSMITMAIVCLLNVGLNFALVFHSPLGYAGIALSTVLSYIVGAVLNSFHLGKWFSGASRRSLSVIKKIAATVAGRDSSDFLADRLHSAFFDTGFAAVRYHRGDGGFHQRSSNRGGDLSAAFALNMANAVVVGNMLGERRNADAFRGGIVTAAIGVVMISLMTVVIVVNARTLSGALSGNSLVIEESVRYLYISMASEPLMAWAVILGGALNGAGDTRGVMRVVITSQWLVRLPMAYLLGVRLGFALPPYGGR